MTDRLAMWLVRLALLGVAGGLVWWGLSIRPLTGDLQLASADHAVSRHNGGANKLSASEDVLGDLASIFSTGAIALGGVGALFAVFPYRLLRKTAAKR